MKTLLLFLLFPLFGFPNAKVAGNGADAVVCRNQDGAILSVELLDYFEARQLRNIRVELPEGDTPEEIAIKALAGLWARDPMRAERYQNFISRFEENTTPVDGALVDIPDSNHVVMPDGCLIEQLLIRQKKQVPEDSLFLVSRPLWSKMSDKQRAGAMLHEALYEEALENHAENSSLVRYFHSKLVSKDILQMSDREYLDMMRVVSRYFPLRHLQGMQMSGVSVILSSWFRSFERARFHFSEDGRLTGIKNDKALPFAFPGFQYRNGKHLVFSSTTVHSSSNLPCLVSEVRFTKAPEGPMIEWKNFSSIELAEEKGWGAASCKGISLHGQEVSIRAGSRLILHPNYVQVSLAGESCYRDRGKRYCGMGITVGPEGRVIRAEE